MSDSSPIYTGAHALLDTFRDAGVEQIFVNLGSDHPPLIEAMAGARGAGHNTPGIVVVPHESVGLSAAHGHALLSGRAQAVVVHCDVGTQTLGGAIHNVNRARVPAFVFAGETSVTIDGDAYGPRNRAVQFIQDVPDQHSSVRAYAKWAYPLRGASNIAQVTYRGFQLANSEPKGLAYMSAPRELLATEVLKAPAQMEHWPSPGPSGLSPEFVEQLAGAILACRRGVIVTTYAGRRAQCWTALQRLVDISGLGVVEASATYGNFPADHEQHLGYELEPLLADVDFILLLDCDIPWVPVVARPTNDTPVYQIDVDPLKTDMPLWHFPILGSAAADATLACQQLAAHLASSDAYASQRERKAWAVDIHRQQRQRWQGEARVDATMTPAWLMRCVNDVVMTSRTVVLDESVTNVPAVRTQIPITRPDAYFQSGGSALGWHGGAAIGAKLAAPDREVVALCGDGSYMFSVPSSVHWVARRYGLGFLTIILNNGGWNATKQNLLKLHPDGLAATNDDLWVNLSPAADYGAIAAAAGGAWYHQVSDPAAVPDVLRNAMDVVRGGRAAVVDAVLPAISNQAD
ncbi:MAG: thiamine pyrophosphate-requiring protein [Pseudomonadota bacterium]